MMGKILCFKFLASFAFCGVFGLPCDSYKNAEVQDAYLDRYEDSPSVEEEALDEDQNEVTYEDMLNELANIEGAEEIESAIANNEEDLNDYYSTIADDEVPEEFQQSSDSVSMVAIPNIQLNTPPPVRCGRSRIRNPDNERRHSRGPGPGNRRGRNPSPTDRRQNPSPVLRHGRNPIPESKRGRNPTEFKGGRNSSPEVRQRRNPSPERRRNPSPERSRNGSPEVRRGRTRHRGPGPGSNRRRSRGPSPGNRNRNNPRRGSPGPRDGGRKTVTLL